MTLETINKLEEMEKKLEDRVWEIVEDSARGQDEFYCFWHLVGPLETPNKEADDTDKFIVALRNNAPELLAMARWALENGYKAE